MATIIKIVLLAVALQECLSEPLTERHILEILDQDRPMPHREAATLVKNAIGHDIHLNNKALHLTESFIGTPERPIGTGMRYGARVETIAVGEAASGAKGAIVSKEKYAMKPVVHRKVIKEPMVTEYIEQKPQTQVVTQMVPVQTVQMVPMQMTQQVAAPAVQVQKEIQKEIIEVEKPVIVNKPVMVEPEPKPFVKESIYTRPFQDAEVAKKTRITPLVKIDKVKEIIEVPKETHREEITEQNLFFVNRKKKVVTKFIKIVEVYEAETNEEVGVYYDVKNTMGDNFELDMTNIFETDDHPILIKNETSTKEIIVDGPGSKESKPKFIIREYFDNILVKTHNSDRPLDALDMLHMESFHMPAFSFRPSGHKEIEITTYQTSSPDGKLMDVTEHTYELPGNRLYVERRIKDADDKNPVSLSMKPSVAFDEFMLNGKNMMRITMTYDGSRSGSFGKYGVKADDHFMKKFESFLANMKVSSEMATHSHMKSRNKRSAESDKVEFEGKTYFPTGTQTTLGGSIFESAMGDQIKVESEEETKLVGHPRNEYLRFSEIYLPRKKVHYELVGMRGESMLGGPRDWENLRSMLKYYGGDTDEDMSYKQNKGYSFIH